MGVLLSTATGIGREIWQNWGDTDGSLGDSIVDAAAWALGALTAGAIALGVRWRLRVGK